MSIFDPMPNLEHSSYSLIDAPIPKEEAEQDFLVQFAPLIVAAYRRVAAADVETLSPTQVAHALSAVKQGDRLVYALDEDRKPAGLFAYSIYRPDTHPTFYNNVREEAAGETPATQEDVEAVRQVMVAKELAVAKESLGKNLSAQLRGIALQGMQQQGDDTEARVILGEAQSGKSVRSRLQIPGITIWGNHLLESPHNNGQDPHRLIRTANTLGKAYLRTQSPSARATYDNTTGTYFSPEFDKPLPPPEKPFQAPILAALADIRRRQAAAQEGQVAASMVVTKIKKA